MVITKAPKCLVLESVLDGKYMCMNYHLGLTYQIKHQHSAVLAISFT